MKSFKLLLLLLSFASATFAQKENYVWYFGDSAGVDFNSGIPIALINGSLNTIEGCASISDSAGNILFYTNGNKVYNRNHFQMQNGFGLAGGFSATQSSLIVPFVGNSLLYYIFTVSHYGSNSSFNYSVVDMTLDGGNGDVTIKNYYIMSPIGEKLTAVNHSNNIDIWVTIHGENNNVFYSYLINGSGVSSNPVTSSVGPNFTINEVSGQMKFSPNGTKLAYAASGINYVDLFDFNSATGTVTNEKYLPLPIINNGAYGLEFSPSGHFLYCSVIFPSIVYQWDITSNVDTTINSTIQQINSSANMQFGSMQLAPNGKIYVAEVQNGFLGAINYPEITGYGCNFIDSAISLNGKSSFLGLPNMIQSGYKEVGLSENSLVQQIQVYPNPFVSNISVTIQKSNYSQAKLVVKNILGLPVLTYIESNTHVNTLTIETSQFGKGVYFFEISIDGERITKKIIKQ